MHVLPFKHLIFESIQDDTIHICGISVKDLKGSVVILYTFARKLFPAKLFQPHCTQRWLRLVGQFHAFLKWRLAGC